MRQESRSKQAQVFAFVQGYRSNIGVDAPLWIYQIVALLRQRYPISNFESGRACGRHLLDVLRSRLTVALRLASKGQRRA